MLIYLATLVLSMLFAWRLQRAATLQREYGNDGLWRFVWLFLLLVLLGGVVGFRNGVGTDYFNYIDIYTLTVEKPYDKIWAERESLFGFLNRICADVFGEYLPVFVISGMLTVVLILYGIYKESSEYVLSFFLLIAGMYYFDLFNGTRQMISTAIMFAAYPLLRRGKWLWLIVLTIIACEFHSSAVLILLVFFFSTKVRPTSPVLWITIGAFALIYIFYNAFVENLINLLNATDSIYADYEDWLVMQDQGANALRFGLAAVPGIMGLLFWKQLRQQREDAGTLLNLSIINALFMLIATKHWIFARFSMFFGIYNILLWPEILKCFEPQSRRFMRWGVMAVYFVYFWLIVHTDSNLLPYESWLFGGVYH